MTFKESTQILALLSANYPHFYKKLSKSDTNAVINTWQMSFADVPAAIVFKAIKRCFLSCKYPPTIADANEQIRKMYVIAGCVSNDIRYTQEQRSEAARLERLLYDLGFSGKLNEREFSLNACLDVVSNSQSGFKLEADNEK